MVLLKFNGLNWLDRLSSHKLEQITWNKERMVAIFAKECTVGFLLEIVMYVHTTVKSSKDFLS